jgi:hypothetical protein
MVAAAATAAVRIRTPSAWCRGSIGVTLWRGIRRWRWRAVADAVLVLLSVALFAVLALVVKGAERL